MSMKRLSLLLFSCIMTFLTVTLSSCANRIPSMYVDVNAPKPQLGEVNRYDEQSEEAESVSDEQYSDLTDNVSVTPSNSSSKTVSRNSISSPTMYSAIIPSSPSPTPSSSSQLPSQPSSLPSSQPSSSSQLPSQPSSQPSSAPSDLDEIPTTDSSGIEVELEDALYNNFIRLLNQNYNITDSFEYDTSSKDAQMSIVVTMCEDKLKVDAQSNVQYFLKEDIENTYENYFGTRLNDPSALTSKSGVKYADGRYELIAMPEKLTQTKYIRTLMSLGDGYFKIITDIRSGGSVIASATYVVKVNASSPYGANLIAQKIADF